MDQIQSVETAAGKSAHDGAAESAPTRCCLAEGRREFVNLWGEMAQHWGINRTMAQVHALLLVSPEPIPAEQIMEHLHISRGNASMNLRELIHWGVVRRTNIPGDRRDFYVAEGDVWTMFHHIFNERKRRELDPLLHRLDVCMNCCAGKVVAPALQPGYDKFVQQVQDLRDFFTIFHRIFGHVGGEQPGNLARMVKAFEQML